MANGLGARPRASSGWREWGAFALLTTLAPSAAADDPDVRLPVAEAERPLTLPRLVLSPELDLDFARFPANFYQAVIVYPGESVPSLVFANLTIGAAFGVTDDITLRAIVAPLRALVQRGGRGEGEERGVAGRGQPARSGVCWSSCVSSPPSP